MKIRIKYVIPLFLGIFLLVSCNGTKSPFIYVEDGHFVKNGKPYSFVGTNFWYGAILGSAGQGGNRERLIKELDALKDNGICNLRVLVGSDGLGGDPRVAHPTLQKEPGVYNDTILVGLDFLLAEMGKRDMQAVLFLNNTWNWSGGYGVYLDWAGENKIDPELLGMQVGMQSDRYRKRVRFSSSLPAQELFYNHVRFIVGRTNTITGKPYSEDPAIFSWQVGNEPRPEGKTPEIYDGFVNWVQKTASIIKSIDSNHMVSTGSEGQMGSENDLELWNRLHNCPDIDYLNIHIWPFNWGWIKSHNPEEYIDNAIKNTAEYIEEHVPYAIAQGKPIVAEEFGYPRDGFVFKKGTPTTARDKYYDFVLSKVEDGTLGGCNFWSWGGYAEQAEDHYMWQEWDDYCGDPGMEQQGLNSVYMSDKSTLEVIQKYTK